MKKKQIVVAIASVLLLVVILGFLKFLQIRKAIAEHSNFAPPPVAVSSVVAEKVLWVRELHGVGTLRANRGITLSVEEPGTVSAIYFESGQEVKKGDRLLDLDTAVEEARLKGAKANETMKGRAYERAKTLRAVKTISEQDLEVAQSEADAASAEVASLQAIIERKRVMAPFSGTLGIREVNLGEYLVAGAKVVPLYSLDPLFVEFSLPENAAGTVRAGQPLVVKVDATGNAAREGMINAINPQINEITRTIEVQGTLPNPEMVLRPGMFASVTVALPSKDEWVAVPVSSVSYAPYGNTVYVIEEISSAERPEKFMGVRQQIVELGPTRGNLVAVINGLKGGEQIVSTGTFKLHPGAAVVVNNSVTPDTGSENPVENT